MKPRWIGALAGVIGVSIIIISSALWGEAGFACSVGLITAGGIGYAMGVLLEEGKL